MEIIVEQKAGGDQLQNARQFRFSSFVKSFSGGVFYTGAIRGIEYQDG